MRIRNTHKLTKRLTCMIWSVEVEEMQVLEHLGTYLYLPVLPLGAPITTLMDARLSKRLELGCQ